MRAVTRQVVRLPYDLQAVPRNSYFFAMTQTA